MGYSARNTPTNQTIPSPKEYTPKFSARDCRNDFLGESSSSENRNKWVTIKTESEEMGKRNLKLTWQRVSIRSKEDRAYNKSRGSVPMV